jgi:hypothetical protein
VSQRHKHAHTDGCGNKLFMRNRLSYAQQIILLFMRNRLSCIDTHKHTHAEAREKGSEGRREGERSSLTCSSQSFLPSRLLLLALSM